MRARRIKERFIAACQPVNLLLVDEMKDCYAEISIQGEGFSLRMFCLHFKAAGKKKKKKVCHSGNAGEM